MSQGVVPKSIQCAQTGCSARAVLYCVACQLVLCALHDAKTHKIGLSAKHKRKSIPPRCAICDRKPTQHMCLHSDHEAGMCAEDAQEQHEGAKRTHVVFPSLSSGRRGSDWLPGGVQLIDSGTLKEEELVGDGATASVYKATWLLPKGRHMTVALKHYRGLGWDNRQFAREVGILQLACHENLVRLYGVVVDGPEAKLVLEYVPVTLARAFPTLDTSEKILKVFSGFAAGLAFLHDLRLVHRDVKPANVLLDAALVSKICDFGITKDTETATTTGVQGTIMYLPPELLAGAKIHSSQDVYSFGVVLRECLIQKSPWTGMHEGQILDTLRKGGLPALTEEKFSDHVSKRLARLANECMFADPLKRPSCKMIAEQLAHLQTRGVDFFDKVALAHQQMIKSDRDFYVKQWAVLVKQDPASNDALRIALSKLSKQFNCVPKQECENSFESLQRLSGRASGIFHERLSAFVTGAGGTYHRGPQKGAQESKIKVLRDYSGDYRCLMDYERGTGSFPNLLQLFGAVGKISAKGELPTKGLLVVRVKDRLYETVYDTGYRDILINFLCDGFVGELQLTVEELWNYKKVAHRALVVDRILKDVSTEQSTEQPKSTEPPPPPPPPPPPVEQKAEQKGGDYIFAFGGTQDLMKCVATMEKFGAVSKSWADCASMSRGRSRLGAVVLGDSIYAIGGHDGVNVLASMEKYNTADNTWQPSGTMTSKRDAHACVVFGGEIYVLGGHDGVSSLAAVEKYDPTAKKWTSCASMSSPRSNCAAVVFGACLYVLGGQVKTRFLASVEKYTPSTNQWKTCASMSCSRTYLSCVRLGKHIYALGGCNSKGVPLGSVEKYDPETDVWSECPAMTSPRSQMACVVLGECVYAIGGYDKASNFLSSVEKLEGNKWVKCKNMSAPRLGLAAVVF